VTKEVADGQRPAACENGFEETSLVSIGINKNRIARNLHFERASIVSKESRWRRLRTVVPGQRRFSSNITKH